MNKKYFLTKNQNCKIYFKGPYILHHENLRIIIIHLQINKSLKARGYHYSIRCPPRDARKADASFGPMENSKN